MYLVLDIESVRHDSVVYNTNHTYTRDAQTGGLVAENYDACLARVGDKICKETENCFYPGRLQTPVVACMIAISEDLRLLGVQTIHHTFDRAFTEAFWGAVIGAVHSLGTRTLVTFGGNNFDLPMMEAQALKHGISVPWWFRGLALKPWDDPRSSYSSNETHLDLSVFLSGKSRSGGDLNFWSRLVGLPGKLDCNGSDVDDLVKAGKVNDVVDYCLCDCLNTTGLLFKVLGQVRGAQIPAETYRRLVDAVIKTRYPDVPAPRVFEDFWSRIDDDSPPF